MVQQDIKEGWVWLRSLEDEKWRQAINEFLKVTFPSSESRIPYIHGFTMMKELRKDIERIHEESLSEWFCGLSWTLV